MVLSLKQETRDRSDCQGTLSSDMFLPRGAQPKALHSVELYPGHF